MHFYLPREFSSVLMVIYIPPQGNPQHALNELYQVITSYKKSHPKGLFIGSGGFN